MKETDSFWSRQPSLSAYNSYWNTRSKYRPLGNYTPVPANYNLKDKSFRFSDNILDWPSVNDPCTVIYNEKDGLYYSWILYRDQLRDNFPTDWMEMVSKDCINWTQTEKRLVRGVNATRPWAKDSDVAFQGGSAWLDKDNRFGFGAGALLFLVSMNDCEINGARGDDQSVALYVAPKGPGTPVEQSLSRFIFAKNPTGTDWRDTRMQWDAEHNQLLFVISNHQNVRFYVNKTTDITKFEQTQIFASGYVSGIECPEFHPIIDSATGKHYWLLVAAKQVPQGGPENPEQTILWYLGDWDGRQFTSQNSGIFEYGYDFYAESVSRPDPQGDMKTLLMRGHIGNWAYAPVNHWPLYGFIGGCWEDRELYVENGVAKVRPHLKTDKLRRHYFAPDTSGPIWVKAEITGRKDTTVYELHWSSGDRVLLTLNGGTISFDTANSGSLVLPGKAFAPQMPIAEIAQMDIFINGCCLSFYIDGKQACFQIFPRGNFWGLKRKKGWSRIKSVSYYDMVPLFA